MIDPAKSCLVVIDVQGKLAQLMHNKESLFANIEILIKAARTLQIPIIWCQQNPAALGPTVESIARLLDVIEPVDKFSFSCCGDELFAQKLRDIKPQHVILCGIESHVCVYQTAMDLLDADYNVCIVADAVSSRTPQNRDITLQRMIAEGADLGSTEMLLFELLKTAKHPHFRDLARLIK